MVNLSQIVMDSLHQIYFEKVILEHLQGTAQKVILRVYSRNLFTNKFYDA